MKFPEPSHEELSDIPSVMIRQALDDLIKSEQDGISINMSLWVVNRRNRCSVCLAGAVMVQRIGLPENDGYCSPGTYYKRPEYGSLALYDKLLAINEFRIGHIYVAYRHLSREFPNTIPEKVKITKYDVDSTQFKKDLLALADLLEQCGE